MQRDAPAPPAAPAGHVARPGAACASATSRRSPPSTAGAIGPARAARPATAASSAWAPSRHAPGGAGGRPGRARAPPAEHRALPPGDPRARPRRPGAVAAARARGAGWAFTGASDHLVSEALYLDDPEGNGIEIYRDRPRDEWRRDARRARDGHPAARRARACSARCPRGRAATRACPTARAWGTCTSRCATCPRPRTSTRGAWASTPTVRGYPGALFVSAGRLPPPPRPEHLGHPRRPAAAGGRAGAGALPRRAAHAGRRRRGRPRAWRTPGAPAEPRDGGVRGRRSRPATTRSWRPSPRVTAAGINTPEPAVLWV